MLLWGNLFINYRQGFSVKKSKHKIKEKYNPFCFIFTIFILFLSVMNFCNVIFDAIITLYSMNMLIKMKLKLTKNLKEIIHYYYYLNYIKYIVFTFYRIASNRELCVNIYSWKVYKTRGGMMPILDTLQKT